MRARVRRPVGNPLLPRTREPRPVSGRGRSLDPRVREGGGFRGFGLTFAASFAALASGAAAEPLLADLFQNRAVLQRDLPLPVFGRAAPGETVTVTLGSASAKAKADRQGRWRVDLPAQPAGGPVVLTAETESARQTASDVLIGDVFLCSGQSNMEWPVSAVNNGRTEVAGAADPKIRLLSVAQKISTKPLDRFPAPVAWAAATPETVADFSAACFFFARETRKRVDAPVGLIDASWGGSSIQTWMSAGALRSVGGYDQRLDVLAEYGDRPQAASAKFGALWEDWWRSRRQTPPGREPWSAEPVDLADWKPVPSIGAWETWGVPETAAFDGMIWFRATVDLTPAQAEQGATLSLGLIDDADVTWVNGEPVGAGAGWTPDRLYPLAAGTLKPGRNVVTVNVVDAWSYGGMHGPAEKLHLTFADGSTVPLTGWSYRIGTEPVGAPPPAPWAPITGLTTAHNAMIAPIGPYALRGVLWYQGESSTGEGRAYKALMKGLMADGRRDRPGDLPFLIVQLANFGQPPSGPTESGWAEVREAQRLAALEDGRSAYAVTIDVGDRYDIHPTNKQEVGRRLAHAARKVVYGEGVPPSGPRPVSAERSGDRVLVRFADASGGLVAYSGAPVGFELCGPAPGSCRWVPATLESDVVDLPAAGGPADRVRYCWADSPVCNLYDRSGLPATPFELGVR
jgi:sialate O-acetylesterase